MNEQIQLQTILVLLRKIWLYLLISAVVFAGAGYVYSKYFVTPVYQSSAKMVVNAGVSKNGSDAITYNEIAAATRLVDMYAQVVKSEQVLGPTSEQLNEQYGYHLSFGSLYNRVTVTPVENTPVMEISVVDSDPNRAKQIIDSIIEVSPPLIVEILEASSAKIISHPHVNSVPVSPNTPRNMMLFALVGMVLCFAICLIRQLLDNTVKAAEDITGRIDLPVLGVIPETEASAKHSSYDYNYGYDHDQKGGNDHAAV